MTGVKISALPWADAALDTDQFEVNQGGTSRRVTVGQVAQVAALVAGSGPVDVRTFGVNIMGVQQPPAGMQAAVDWALAAPDSRELYLTGDVWLSGDVFNLHEVPIRGPGTIRISAGPKWHVDPSFLNTGYGALDPNFVYVDSAIGSDANSGLSDVFPVATMSRAQKIVGLKGYPSQGYFEIRVAQCVLPGDTGTFLDTSGPRSMPITVRGPTVAAWDNTAPPREPAAISAITSANPPVVTTAAPHGYSNGETVFIGLAAAGGGMHGADGRIYTVANAAASTFELGATDGTAWAAYTGSGKVYDMNGNAPKCIVYGDGAATGFSVQNDSWVWFYDFHFINCGTKAGGVASGGGIEVRWGANVRCYNIHATDCGFGVVIRDQSNGIVESGRFFNNGSACWAIDSRYTFGAANPTSAALTTTPIFKSNSVGCDIWENANGHADGNIFENNIYAFWIRRSTAYCVAIYNRYINSTGAAVMGVLIEQGGTFVTSVGSDIWTGDFKPRVLRRAGNAPDPDTNAIRMNWLTTQRFAGGTAITPAGGEITVFSEYLQADQFNNQSSAMRFKIVTSGTSAVGNVVFRIKVGSVPLGYTTLAILTVVPVAGIRSLHWTVDMGQNGFDNWRIQYVIASGALAGTTTTNVLTSASYVNNADQTIIVTAEVVNAADTLSIWMYEVERLGW